MPTASHPVSARLRRGDPVDQRLRQLVPLAVHLVFGEVLDAHRLERPRADVQRQRRAFDALFVEACEQRVVEMQGPAVGAATAPGWRANTVW